MKTGIGLVVHSILKFLYFQIKLMVMQKKIFMDVADILKLFATQVP
jgi:hypothetical protein